MQFFYVEKKWTEPGYIASSTSDLYDSRIKFHYINNDVRTKQTDKIGKNVKNTAVNKVL